jgi:biopolymer transport protein ExbD
MKTGTKNQRLITDINMVPFIDVVLVLLIIFMIVSPFLAQSQIPVRLPQAVTGNPVDNDAPVRVQVTKDRVFYIQNKQVARADLLERLRTALMQTRNRTVLVEADKDVAFEDVVAALDVAEQLEAQKVGVAVRPPS